MKKMKTKILLVLALLLLAGIYYYVTLPAINIHSTGFWVFIVAVVVILLALYAAKKRINTVQEIKQSKIMKTGITVILAIVLVYLIGAVLSSPIVNAKKYRNLLDIEERDFTEDIQPSDFNKIPLLDKESAALL